MVYVGLDGPAKGGVLTSKTNLPHNYVKYSMGKQVIKAASDGEDVDWIAF